MTIKLMTIKSSQLLILFFMTQIHFIFVEIISLFYLFLINYFSYLYLYVVFLIGYSSKRYIKYDHIHNIIS